MRGFTKIVFFVSFFSCSFVYAQFLPDNSTLNVQSVQRWMDSNRDFSAVMQSLDEMHKTDVDLKKFDALPATEQDQQITKFLQSKHAVESTNEIVIRHGWKSLGEYMRLSTKLGDAIAAYFFTEQMIKLTEAQQKALREKTDPVVLSVPSEDIVFVKSHETLLKNYIQAYAKGR